MARVRFTHQAREDLSDIWVYIATRNPQAADRVCDRIEDNCEKLRQFPLLGAVRPEIAEGARALIVEHWIVFYRLVEHGVQVVRIVDGALDLTRRIWPSGEEG